MPRIRVRPGRPHLGRIGVALAAGLGTLAIWPATLATAQGTAVPLPDDDPFYAQPADLEPLENGSVLDSRPVTAKVLGVPMAAAAWQVKYKTIDQHGEPSAYVTTVLIPTAAWSGNGPRPLVSYQTFEDSVGTRCAPSYALRSGLTDNSGNGAEAALIAQAVQRGFAVTVPDHEGPRSEFLGAAGAAHGVLDGIRAAKNFPTADIDADAPVGLMGYSGGALATSLAIQLQPTYAPELELAGAALGGVVADLKATLLRFNGSPVGGGIAIAFVGLDRSYPDADVSQYMNSAGRRAMANSQADCLLDAVIRYPFASLHPWPIGWGAKPGVIDTPAFSELLRDASPLGRPGTPVTPVLFYHSVLDELAPISKMRLLADRFCTEGVTVHKAESFAGEHAAYAIVGAPTALDYLADRFAAKPAPDDC